MNMNLKAFVDKNVISIITALLVIGGLISVIKVQGKAIDDILCQIKSDKDRIVTAEKEIIEFRSVGSLVDNNNSSQISVNTTKINGIEKSLVKLDSMQSDISDIKSDIREIKGIIMSPNYKVVDMNQFTHGSTASR